MHTENVALYSAPLKNNARGKGETRETQRWRKRERVSSEPYRHERKRAQEQSPYSRPSSMRGHCALAFFSLTAFQLSASYKFLGFSPQWAVSHVNYLGKIADALVEAGHEVVSLLPCWKEGGGSVFRICFVTVTGERVNAKNGAIGSQGCAVADGLLLEIERIITLSRFFSRLESIPRWMELARRTQE